MIGLLIAFALGFLVSRFIHRRQDGAIGSVTPDLAPPAPPSPPEPPTRRNAPKRIILPKPGSGTTMIKGGGGNGG